MLAKICRWAIRVSAGLHGGKRPPRERGATLVEYTLLLALIAVVAIGSLIFVGKAVTSTANDVAVQIASSGGTDPASQIVLTGTDGDLASGNTSTFSATIEDDAGIAITTGPDSTDAVTFNESGHGSVTSPGDVITASGGIANDNLTAKTVGSVTVTATVTLHDGTKLTSNPITFTIVPGNGTTLVFTVQPAGGSGGAATDGAVWSPAATSQPQVTVYDAAHNVATTFVGTITLAIASGPAGGILGCSETNNQQAVASGVANFTGCNIQGPAGSYTLNATVAALSQASNAVTISAGLPAKLVFSTQPADTTGGVAIPPPPAASVEDQYGDVVTSDDSSSLTLSITAATGASGAVLTCTSSATDQFTVSSGVATFSDCSINLASGTAYELTATDTTDAGVPAVNSLPFDVSVGDPAKIVFSRQPGGAVAASALSPQPVVELEDAGGNVVTSDNSSSLTVAIATNPGDPAGTLSGCNIPLTVAAGVGTFSGCSINNAGNGYTLTVTDTTDSISATSSAFNITGAPAQLAFDVQPGEASELFPFNQQPVVWVEDSNGNLVTSDNTSSITLTLHVGFPAGAVLSGCNSPLTVTGGVGTFAGCTVSAESEFDTLTAASAGLTSATSDPFNVAGVPAQIVFSTQPGGASAEFPFTQQPVVEVEDDAFPFPNVVTSDDTSQITLTLNPNPSGGILSGCTAAVTVKNGVATFSGCEISVGGQGYSLHADDTTDGFTVDSDDFNVAGAPAELAFARGGQPGDAIAGEAFGNQPVVDIEDAHGNIVTSDHSSTISMAIFNNPANPAGVLSSCSDTVTNGVATFTGCQISNPGDPYTLRATDTSDPGEPFSVTSDDFDVEAPPTQLAFNFQPGDANAGENFEDQPGVVVEDAAGNTVTNDDTSQVTLTITSGTGASGAVLTCTTNPVTVTDGEAYFGGGGPPYDTGCQINLAGSNYTLTAASTGLTSAVSNAFNVVGTPSQLAFTVQPSSTTAGSAFNPDVEVSVEDANKNVVTTDRTTNVTLKIGTNPSGGTLTCGGGTTQEVFAGVAEFYDCSINDAGNGYTLTATSAGLTGATSSAFDITPKPQKLVFTQEPGNIVAGSYFTPSITVSAELNNNTVVTTDESTQITLSGPFESPVTCTNDTETVVNGVATFTDCTVTEVGNGYRLTATDETDAGVPTVNSTAFNVTPGPAYQLVFTNQPGGATSGSALSAQPQVTVEDQYGNTVTTDGNKVTLTVTAGSPVGTLACTTNTVTFAAGVANFAGCKITGAAGSYTLTATDSGDGGLTVVSTAFNITAAPAKLVFTQQPGNIIAGNNFAPNVTVSAETAGGVVLTSDQTTQITLSGPASLTCYSGLTVTVVNGVATFYGCTITTAGNNDTLTATDAADSLTVTSNTFNVTAGPAAQLVFNVQPGGAAAGSNLSPQPQVTVEDQYGNTVTTDTNKVTLTVRAGSPGGTLTCTTNPVTFATGVAAFAGCNITGTDGTYHLTATDSGDGHLTVGSAAFAITAGPPASMKFTATPGNGSHANTLAPNPAVTIYDQYGNVATNDSASKVTLSINTGTGTLTCTSGLQVTAAAGVATWTGCKISSAGTDTLHAVDNTDAGVAAVNSGSFTLS